MQLYKSLSNLFKVALSLPGYLFFPLITAVKKKENLVCVFAPKSGAFSDNSKYAWLSLRGREDMETWFIVFDRKTAAKLRREGVRAAAIPSPFAIWLCLRCRIAIGCDYEAFRDFTGNLLLGARRVQLWHGSGIKNVSMDAPQIADLRRSRVGRLRLEVKRKFPVFDLFYFPSRDNFERRKETFRFVRAAINGLLRNDLLTENSYGGMEFVGTDRVAGARIEEMRRIGRRMVLYAPTWRSGDRDDIGDRIPFDLDRLQALMEELDAALVMKLHPNMNDRLKLDGYSRIFEYDRDLDIYPHLKSFDLMVSDFSSFIPDFALLGRAIVLYLPDLPLLIEEKRFSPAELDAFMGERCLRPEDLDGCIRHALSSAQPGAYANLSRFHDYTEGGSGERFAADIAAMMDLAAGEGSPVVMRREKTGIAAL